MSLTINHLTVDIEKTPILQEVSLSVVDGELLSLLGPSGCGAKYTAEGCCRVSLNCQGGRLVQAQSGWIICPRISGGIVVVFQDLRLFSNMNVIDNVAFPLKKGKKRAERREKGPLLFREGAAPALSAGGSPSFRAASSSGWP